MQRAACSLLQCLDRGKQEIIEVLHILVLPDQAKHIYEVLCIKDRFRLAFNFDGISREDQSFNHLSSLKWVCVLWVC